jgi:hypothetical protein
MLLLPLLLPLAVVVVSTPLLTTPPLTKVGLICLRFGGEPDEAP